ncbi:MAG: type III secretion system chaperone [Saprospiraceae bacterium]|nr:type III secretion system chaperone [Saprospiraceae bacterium]
MRQVLLVVVFICSCTALAMAQEGQMNNTKLEEIIKKESALVEGQTGAWQVLFGDRILLVITDEANNRMRIFTPIVEEESVETIELRTLLNANFHSALDAKYSIYNGFVVSVFTHPLKELTDVQLLDALEQVANLANNYGTTYSSTELIFGGDQSPPIEEKKINESPSRKGKKL